jgi:hypothetical protein
MITGTFKFQCVCCTDWFEAPAAVNEPVTVHCPNCHTEYNMQFIPSERKQLISKLEVIRAQSTNQHAVHQR